MSRSIRFRCAGIALTEMVVSMLALIPLMFAVPMIGKLINVRQQAILASRHVVWEGTVRSNVDSAEVSRQLEARFFNVGPGDGSIASSSSATPGEAGTGSARGMPKDTAVQIIPGSIRALPYETDLAADTTVARVGRHVEAAGKLLEPLSSTEWSLTGNGLIRGGLSLQVRSNGWSRTQGADCESGVYGCVTEQSVILADGWSSSGDTQAEKRVRSLVPAAALEPLGNALSVVGALPVFRELRKLEGAFGTVSMDVLPSYLETPQ